MGMTSIWHWIILLVVVVAVFGTSKIKNAGKDIGQAVKGFKDAVKDENQSLEQKPNNNDIRVVNSDEVTIKDNHNNQA